MKEGDYAEAVRMKERCVEIADHHLQMEDEERLRGEQIGHCCIMIWRHSNVRVLFQFDLAWAWPILRMGN